MQKQAVAAAASHGLFILTGGPGTGKTTTINAIIRYFEEEGAELRLAAPTGRAAKRMTEATGCSAHRAFWLNSAQDNNIVWDRQLHRLLFLSGSTGSKRRQEPG